MSTHEKWTPESDTNEFMRKLRENENTGSEGEAERQEPEAPPRQVQRTAETALPDVVADVLQSPDRDELIAVARTLHYARREPRSIVFRLEQGDIKCRYMWSNVRLEALTGDQMYVIKIRSADMVFTPKPGAILDVAHDAARAAVRVVCLTAPLSIYPGIDLLCFMLHTDPMQKDGKLKEDAPSVVSGKPSTHVVDGEPVADGERPAAATELRGTPAVKNYDEPRQG